LATRYWWVVPAVASFTHVALDMFGVSIFHRMINSENGVLHPLSFNR
jgi:hypothetical protein